MTNYQDTIRDAILDEANFVRATFSGRQRGQEIRWERLELRPVEVKGQRHLQFSFFDAKQNIVKNYAGETAVTQLTTALDLPFRNFHIISQNETIQINLSKKGKPIINRKANETTIEVSLAHDRSKNTILTEGEDIPFLKVMGVMRADGRIKANHRSKFQQINAFLKILDEIDEIAALQEPVRMIDFGCGSAYLTFAAYHYLVNILGKQAQIIGVDGQEKLIAKNQAVAAKLGWDGLTFEHGMIIDYQADPPPNIVVALHACDTATDDTLAQGIRWQSELIIAAPCCHHHLQVQLKERPSPPEFDAVLRHNLLQERLGDILTDAIRAAILRMNGYQVTAMEFISPDHTPKNLLLRAVKKGDSGGGETAVAEYTQLQQYWQVEPYLAQLLKQTL
ncbi:MAG: SAM-dependent methyltransferase [Ardenticatenaceae bacterium]|nr:SAM-dependent methyltransferase [Anaerolineales bacterium]MCB8937712.1 SAM-dependent methyltransferase [Ardenticatenaceae bacterium]MCB8974281.1 SAM-dependent methyltransferase [Ardenticatenaceae bacterium]